MLSVISSRVIPRVATFVQDHFVSCYSRFLSPFFPRVFDDRVRGIQRISSRRDRSVTRRSSPRCFVRGHYLFSPISSLARHRLIDDRTVYSYLLCQRCMLISPPPSMSISKSVCPIRTGLQGRYSTIRLEWSTSTARTSSVIDGRPKKERTHLSRERSRLYSIFGHRTVVSRLSTLPPPSKLFTFPLFSSIHSSKSLRSVRATRTYPIGTLETAEPYYRSLASERRAASP